MAVALYEEEFIEKIAQSIRAGLKIEDLMSIEEMPKYINRLGNPYIYTSTNVSNDFDEEGNWIRPSEYEPVDTLTWENNEEVCYLSLYNNGKAQWKLALYITASKGYKVQLGHVVEGEFVPIEEPELKNSNAIYIKNLPEDEISLVAKITSQNILYPITYLAFSQLTAAQANSAVNIPYYYQPVVERVGNLPYISSTANSGTSRGFGCAVMERDALNFGSFTTLTSLSNCWNYCYNLKELSVNNIDTSRWRVTSLASMFQNCASIKKIDLSKWDTSNWVVTTLSSAFNGCTNLIELNVGSWDTSNWAVTTLANTFAYCYSIESYVIENWNTTNWKVTTLANAFQYNYSLKSLDLSHWVTTGWAVTTLTYMFDNCISLHDLNINSWNTSNWAVTTMSYVFQYCLSLPSLDLSNWNTSNWAVNTLVNCFSNCRSLKRLQIEDWNTSNWAVTTVSNLFSYCYCLTQIPVENWDTSNWPLSVMSTFIGYCGMLKSLDLSHWNNSKFNLTDCKTFNTQCRNLYYMNITPITNLTATATTVFAVVNESNLNLTEIYPQQSLPVDQSYSSMANLSKESLIRILNNLPQTSVARKLTLGNLRAKLSVDDLTIATNKGWTIA